MGSDEERNPAPQFAGKTHLVRYSNSLMELDYNIGRIMDVIPAEAPIQLVKTAPSLAIRTRLSLYFVDLSSWPQQHDSPIRQEDYLGWDLLT